MALEGNKIVFAGGQRGYGDILTRVDIYDVVTHSWSTAELSVARSVNFADSQAFELFLDVSTMLGAAIRGTQHLVLKGTPPLVFTVPSV